MQRPDPDVLRQTLQSVTFFGGLDTPIWTCWPRRSVACLRGRRRGFPGGGSKQRPVSGPYRLAQGSQALPGWTRTGAAPDWTGGSLQRNRRFRQSAQPRHGNHLGANRHLADRQRTVRQVLDHTFDGDSVMERMADRIGDLVTPATDLSLRTVEERLARLLLQTQGDVLVRPPGARKRADPGWALCRRAQPGVA